VARNYRVVVLLLQAPVQLEGSVCIGGFVHGHAAAGSGRHGGSVPERRRRPPEAERQRQWQQ
jgi:hypothetical protein